MFDIFKNMTTSYFHVFEKSTTTINILVRYITPISSTIQSTLPPINHTTGQISAPGGPRSPPRACYLACIRSTYIPPWSLYCVIVSCRTRSTLHDVFTRFSKNVIFNKITFLSTSWKPHGGRAPLALPPCTPTRGSVRQAGPTSRVVVGTYGMRRRYRCPSVPPPPRLFRYTSYRGAGELVGGRGLRPLPPPQPFSKNLPFENSSPGNFQKVTFFKNYNL